jgi:hypothetical protein
MDHVWNLYPALQCGCAPYKGHHHHLMMMMMILEPCRCPWTSVNPIGAFFHLEVERYVFALGAVRGISFLAHNPRSSQKGFPTQIFGIWNLVIHIVYVLLLSFQQSGLCCSAEEGGAGPTRLLQL